MKHLVLILPLRGYQYIQDSLSFQQIFHGGLTPLRGWLDDTLVVGSIYYMCSFSK